MNYQATYSYAKKMDAEDPLRHMRAKFHIPRNQAGTQLIYFCGHSLGLQAHLAAEYLEEYMESWRIRGVEGHFDGPFPWMPYHEFLQERTADLVGAECHEVVTMNSLTANLHFMMVSFFRPKNNRKKILLEQQAFPSDHYAAVSQLQFHGLDAEVDLLLVKPRQKGGVIEDVEWLQMLDEYGDDIALVLLPGVQYLSGQVFDIEKIAQKCREKGCFIGVDLAHAVGNIPLKLHSWDVDFACWCHYKYLNSGPGATGGCFVHAKHHSDEEITRFAGWWGHEKESRFKMAPGFKAITSAEGWQLSNPPIASLALIRASLDTFQAAGGMEPLRAKSVLLTGYLEYLLKDKLKEQVKIVTSADVEKRGCQLSLVIAGASKSSVHKRLTEEGIICDWREPNIMRLAPVPLYNQFSDVYHFVAKLHEILT